MLSAPELFVGDLMTIHPVTITPDATIEAAEQLMLASNVSGLPVVDDTDEVIGVISQSDLLRTGSPLLSALIRRSPSGLRVGELMTTPAVTVLMRCSLVEAARLMRDEGIHRLVAVDDAGRAIGVLSASDYVALYAEG